MCSGLSQALCEGPRGRGEVREWVVALSAPSNQVEGRGLGIRNHGSVTPTM